MMISKYKLKWVVPEARTLDEKLLTKVILRGDVAKSLVAQLTLPSISKGAV